MIWVAIVIAVLALWRCFVLERQLTRIRKAALRLRQAVNEMRATQ